MRTGIKILAVVMAVSTFAKTSHADYFVWADEKTGLTASFPDSWKITANQQPDDVLTLSLPSGNDDAKCFIRADLDKRFLIYPQHLRKDVQKVAYSKDFWKEYNATFQNVQVLGYGDETGMGKGYASTQMITYSSAPDEPFENRAAIMSVSNYYDKTYIAQCSAKQDSYSKYATSFLSFMKTIDMKKAYHELRIGNHPRDFLQDPHMEFRDPNAVSTHRH